MLASRNPSYPETNVSHSWHRCTRCIPGTKRIRKSATWWFFKISLLLCWKKKKRQCARNILVTSISTDSYSFRLKPIAIPFFCAYLSYSFSSKFQASLMTRSLAAWRHIVFSQGLCAKKKRLDMSKETKKWNWRWGKRKRAREEKKYIIQRDEESSRYFNKRNKEVEERARIERHNAMY